MPRTTKPRKQYRRREVARPLTAPAHRRLALEIRLAVETLVAVPSVESYNTVSKMLAALTRAGMKCDALERANGVMDAVVERYSRVGKVGLKEAESEVLRQAIAVIDGRMATIPANRIAEAVASVEVFCATAGA